MTMDSVEVRWRKTSGGDGGNCVELAFSGFARDSKNRRGPVLDVGPKGVAGLVMAAKAGLLDGAG